MRRKTGEIPDGNGEDFIAEKPASEQDVSNTEAKGQVVYFPKPDAEVNRLTAETHELDLQLRTVSQQLDGIRFWEIGEKRRAQQELDQVNKERVQAYHELYARDRERFDGPPKAAQLHAAFRKGVLRVLPNLNIPDFDFPDDKVGRATILPQTDTIRIALKSIAGEDPALAPFAEQGLRLQEAMLSELKTRGSGGAFLKPEDYSDRVILLREGTSRLMGALKKLGKEDAALDLRLFEKGSSSFERAVPRELIKDLAMAAAIEKGEKKVAATQALKVIGVLKDLNEGAGRSTDLSRVKFSDEPGAEQLAAK